MEGEEFQPIFAFDDFPEPLAGNCREVFGEIHLSQEDRDRVACRNLGDCKYLLSVMLGDWRKNPLEKKNFIKARSV